MYVARQKKKQGGKTYHTTLIRESYRENGKVKNRTISNISKLEPKHIAQIERILSGNAGEFNLSDLELGASYEYGGSTALRQLASEIGLDKAICSTKTQWREDVMAMIIGRILYQGSKLSLINQYNDTVLWEQAGHELGVKPDVKENCYSPMDELLKRKNRIDVKFAKKHLANGSIILYDMTNTWLEGEYLDSKIVTYGKAKGGKRGYKQVSLGLLTNSEGCPVAVEIFKGNTSDQSTVLDQIKKISKKYGITKAIFTGDRGMLTQKRVDEIRKTDFKIITALNHKELRSLVDKESLQLDLFDQTNITEVVNSEDPVLRYMLCKNDNEMAKERATRTAMINKVVEQLATKAAVTRKREPQEVAASIGRIFSKYSIGKFFEWNVDHRGGLTWSTKDDVIDKEAELDGCYVIKTTADTDTLSKDEVVNCYRDLQKVEQAFKNMKTVMLELRPIYHKSDERIESHIFLVMLSYYLQWHAMQKLKPLFEADGQGQEKRWTFEGTIERLKSIRKTDCLIKGVTVKTEITKPDEEQAQILTLLGVKIM